MTDDELLFAELERDMLSSLLERPAEPKEFCTATKRNPRTGYIVGDCSFHALHANDHRDVHTGVTWA